MESCGSLAYRVRELHFGHFSEHISSVGSVENRFAFDLNAKIKSPETLDEVFSLNLTDIVNVSLSLI